MNNIISVEQIEKDDWKIINVDSDDIKRQKSISSYYLNEWYEKIKDLTFETYIYKITNDIMTSLPEKLPFELCMVRYENKSPKDSEHWGPCRTPKDVQQLFDTSLRCQSKKGSYICIRKWCNDISREYRCFWNDKLVAVGYASDEDFAFNESICHEIQNYVQTIKHRIPYHRCVFDIGILKSGQYIIVEFNSWETNSGAHAFDWKKDTEILYPDNEIDTYKTYYKSLKNTIIITNPNVIYNNIISKYDSTQVYNMIKSTDNIINSARSNYVVTASHIILSTDIWLVVMNHNFKPLCWKRGEFRFCNIENTISGLLKLSHVYDGENHANSLKYMYPQTLQVYEDKYNTNTHINLKTMVKQSNVSTNVMNIIGKYTHDNRYGFYYFDKDNKKLQFIRLMVGPSDYYFYVVPSDVYDIE